MLRKLHLNFVITLLTLVLCMGVLCNYSKASEEYLPYGFSDILEEDLIHFGVTNYYDTVYSYFSNKMTENGSITRLVSQDGTFVHYTLFPVEKEFYQAYSGISNFDNTSTSVDAVRFSANYNNTVRQYAAFSNTQLRQGDTIYLQLFLFNGGRIWLIDNITNNAQYYNMSRNCYTYDYDLNSFGSPSSYNEIYNGYWGNANWVIESGYGSSYSTICNISDIITYNGFAFQTTGNNYSVYYFEDNWENYFPSAVEDDRLSIYTLQTNNGKQLNIDLSAFRDGYSAAVIKTFSDVVITLDCDGSEIEYTLDSNNSNIIDIWSATNNVHTIQTLYNYFDLDSYDDVFISKVSFSLTTSSPGGSGTEAFNIACQHYLKDTNTAPITPEVIEDPTYNDTNIYDNIQINNIKHDLHEYSSRFSFLSGTWNFVLEQDLPEFPGWATVYTNYVWFADGNSDTTYRGHWFQMANNIPSIADLTRPFDPSEFLEQNKTFAFYDVILLKVFTVEVLSGSSPIDTYDLEGYLVFISDRYYDHYNARLNLDILTQLQLSAENSVLFFDAAKARLDGIAADLGTGFNGLIDTSTGTQYKIISWLQTVNDNMSGSFINLSNTLSDGFSSVVAAINNISTGGSSYSLPALSDALSFLFTPTLEWSAINYDDYEESLGVLALPFQFTFDVLDIAQNQYDPHFKLHLNELSLDVPLEAGENPVMTNFTVIEDQDIDQDPLDVIPSGLWTTLQYLNAFGLVVVQALSTYNHIFRR